MTPAEPNATLQELVEVLGEDSARELVRSFLQGLPTSLRALATAPREEQVRIVHGLKSSARHMGADALARSLTSLETRLALRDATLGEETLGQLAREFDRVAASLRPFAYPPTRRPGSPPGPPPGPA